MEDQFNNQLPPPNNDLGYDSNQSPNSFKYRDFFEKLKLDERYNCNDPKVVQKWNLELEAGLNKVWESGFKRKVRWKDPTQEEYRGEAENVFYKHIKAAYKSTPYLPSADRVVFQASMEGTVDRV
jgi:hypothetical protein